MSEPAVQVASGSAKPEWLLLFTAITGLVLVHYWSFDFLLADWIYQHTGFAFRRSFIGDDILHKGTRLALIVCYLSLWSRMLIMRRQPDQARASADLLVMLLSIGMSVLLITTLKRVLEVDCPWDLLRYGGNKAFFPLFEYPEALLPSAHCYPASHASVGYSWLAVYFYAKVTGNPHNIRWLVAVLLMGTGFAVTQQFRGAHFVSHDLTSLLLCLLVCMVVYACCYDQSGKPRTLNWRRKVPATR
jgi:membrane-associated PAP2 superfamily phosphatase